MIFNPVFEKGGLPLSEYPRPQFKRKSYLSLNGLWEYKIFKGEEPCEYDGKIVVPYSPECDLSGVNRQLQKDETLIYRRFFTVPKNFNEGAILLNFGACDQVTVVYVNGVKVGENFGGYLPFTFDITAALNDGENELKVVVVDDADSDVFGYLTDYEKTEKGYRLSTDSSSGQFELSTDPEPIDMAEMRHNAGFTIVFIGLCVVMLIFVGIMIAPIIFLMVVIVKRIRKRRSKGG